MFDTINSFNKVKIFKKNFGSKSTLFFYLPGWQRTMDPHPEQDPDPNTDPT